MPIMKYEKDKVIQNIVEKNRPGLLIQVLRNNFHDENVFPMIIEGIYHMISKALYYHRILSVDLGVH